MMRTWISRSAWLVAVTACHTAPAARSGEPVANIAPVAATRPTSVTCVRGASCALVWRAGTRELVATVVPDDYVEVEVAISGAPDPERLDLGIGVHVERLGVLDVTGDGKPDLIVWIDQRPARNITARVAPTCSRSTTRMAARSGSPSSRGPPRRSA
jgi:antitoxin (DNA-binding transcriptional repressor) of toxin-antitoxin stability system